MRILAWFQTLSGRLGLVTSTAILLVSLVFSGYRYVNETNLLTDQLHAHMGENVAALMASMSGMDSPAALQRTLEAFLRAVDTHVHEFEHEPIGQHLVLVLDGDGRVLASPDAGRIGKPLPAELRWLSGQHTPSAADKFRTLTLDGQRYLGLSEPLGGGRRILYLEPYASVTRLARGSLVRNLVFSLLLAASLAVIVQVLMRKLVIRRLEVLAQAMERVERERDWTGRSRRWGRMNWGMCAMCMLGRLRNCDGRGNPSRSMLVRWKRRWPSERPSFCVRIGWRPSASWPPGWRMG